MNCPYCRSEARTDLRFACGSGPSASQRSIACREREIRRLRVRVADLDDELVAAKARIARLENACDAMADWLGVDSWHATIWRAAKEAQP
jgi:hypothetical protein